MFTEIGAHYGSGIKQERECQTPQSRFENVSGELPNLNFDSLWETFVD